MTLRSYKRALTLLFARQRSLCVTVNQLSASDRRAHNSHTHTNRQNVDARDSSLSQRRLCISFALCDDDLTSCARFVKREGRERCVTNADESNENIISLGAAVTAAAASSRWNYIRTKWMWMLFGLNVRHLNCQSDWCARATITSIRFAYNHKRECTTTEASTHSHTHWLYVASSSTGVTSSTHESSRSWFLLMCCFLHLPFSFHFVVRFVRCAARRSTSFCSLFFLHPFHSFVLVCVSFFFPLVLLLLCFVVRFLHTFFARFFFFNISSCVDGRHRLPKRHDNNRQRETARAI